MVPTSEANLTLFAEQIRADAMPGAPVPAVARYKTYLSALHERLVTFPREEQDLRKANVSVMANLPQNKKVSTEVIDDSYCSVCGKPGHTKTNCRTRTNGGKCLCGFAIPSGGACKKVHDKHHDNLRVQRLEFFSKTPAQKKTKYEGPGQSQKPAKSPDSVKIANLTKLVATQAKSLSNMQKELCQQLNIELSGEVNSNTCEYNKGTAFYYAMDVHYDSMDDDPEFIILDTGANISIVNDRTINNPTFKRLTVRRAPRCTIKFTNGSAFTADMTVKLGLTQSTLAYWVPEAKSSVFSPYELIEDGSTMTINQGGGKITNDRNDLSINIIHTGKHYVFALSEIAVYHAKERISKRTYVSESEYDDEEEEIVDTEVDSSEDKAAEGVMSEGESSEGDQASMDGSQSNSISSRIETSDANNHRCCTNHGGNLTKSTMQELALYGHEEYLRLSAPVYLKQPVSSDLFVEQATRTVPLYNETWYHSPNSLLGSTPSQKPPGTVLLMALSQRLYPSTDGDHSHFVRFREPETGYVHSYLVEGITAKDLCQTIDQVSTWWEYWTDITTILVVDPSLMIPDLASRRIAKNKRIIATAIIKQTSHNGLDINGEVMRVTHSIMDLIAAQPMLSASAWSYALEYITAQENDTSSTAWQYNTLSAPDALYKNKGKQSSMYGYNFGELVALEQHKIYTVNNVAIFVGASSQLKGYLRIYWPLHAKVTDELKLTRVHMSEPEKTMMLQAIKETHSLCLSPENSYSNVHNPFSDFVYLESRADAFLSVTEDVGGELQTNTPGVANDFLGYDMDGDSVDSFQMGLYLQTYIDSHPSESSSDDFSEYSDDSMPSLV
jgi:hypothetical protein